VKSMNATNWKRLFVGVDGTNPDPAVAAETMSEEQTFRSEVNGSLPLSEHRSSVVQDEI
jgi:hypothetical protein